MKNLSLVLVFLVSSFLLSNCKNKAKENVSSAETTSAEENYTLSATEFSKKISETHNAIILDVRTAPEFAAGHIENAANIDINSENFENNVSKLDHSKPIFVYCLSGARSNAAAQIMKNMGFTSVYELSGGMLQWRAANLPETTNITAKIAEITKAKFNEMVSSDKMVLVDFYADWCEPCKKMKPYLDEIENNRSAEVKVVRINADENKNLCKELEINALPVLHIYKNDKLIWQKTGFVSKEEVLEKLK